MNLKENLRSFTFRLSQISTKYYKYFPYLSLLLGILTILLWQRSFDFIRWAFIYFIIIGITTILLLGFIKYLSHKNKTVPSIIWCIEFINQNLYQDLILFLLPIYYQSSTIYSKNVMFLIIIAALAVITTFDNAYRTLILRNKVTQFLFYTFNLFAFLNFCMPVLLGMRNIYSLYISMTLSILLLTPLLLDYKEMLKRSKMAAAALIILISLFAVNLLKGFIPPVPLKLVSGTASVDVDRTKKEPIKSFVVISSKGVDAVYCYTSIFAPMGIHERLWHIWKKDEKIVQKVVVEITGGRKDGFRTWSKKTIAENQDKGKWTVDVITDGGQLVGKVRFTIIE